MKRVHVIRRAEEFKALADARRIRLLGWLAKDAHTVTQLAAKLGQLPATVHHHVKVLEKAGLVEIATTREKSGILEKYYRAAAQRIVTDQELGRLDEPAAIALDAASSALRGGINRLDGLRADLALTAVEELKLSAEQARELTARLKAIVAEYEGTGSAAGESWLAVVACYPVCEEGEMGDAGRE